MFDASLDPQLAAAQLAAFFRSDISADEISDLGYSNEELASRLEVLRALPQSVQFRQQAARLRPTDLRICIETLYENFADVDAA